MAYQVDKEANSIACSTNGSVLPQIHVNENAKDCHGSSPVRASPKTKKKTTSEKLEEILLTFNNPPLIPNETALTLLKIQSKFVSSSHPCMCTSRFRHTLHQLDEEHHQDLDRLCSQLSIILKLEDDQETKKEELFDSLVPCVFGDLKGLDQISNEWLVRSGQQDQSCLKHADLQKELNGIIERLVNEYRAIFAIEVEFSRSFEKSDDELHTNTEHHRKRHEEVDCCPEEIKLMKVACEELSLECSSQNSPALPPKFPDQKLDQKSVATTIVSSNPQATTPASNQSNSSPIVNTKSEKGPKFCLKTLTSQEVPEQDNSIHRHPEISHDAALEDLRSRHHHRRSHHHYAQHGRPTDEKVAVSNGVTSSVVKVMPSSGHEGQQTSSTSSSCSNSSVSTDSTPVSSDVEHSHTPSPRRSCQRKRKERRDSIGEAQDKKFSKSSSDVFPTSCVNENKKVQENFGNENKVEFSLGIRRIQSTVEFVTNNNQEDCCLDQKCVIDEQPTPTKGKCTFYVSDEEVSETIQDVKTSNERTRRAIMRPRRSRKVRTDSLKENQEDFKTNETEIESKEPTSPVLPWKKNSHALTPPSLSTPAPISTPSQHSPSVLSLVASIKSSIAENQPLSVEASSSPSEADKDSDSTSSSASDETLSNLDVLEDVDNKSDTSSTSFTARYFDSRHFNSTSPVQDSQYQLYQPASPWERDGGHGESLTPATLWEPHGNVAWKNEIDLESEETRDDFQSTRHFGMVNSRQFMDKNQGLWNRNPANENSGSSQKSKSKMKQLTKQLSFVKNQIEEFEVKYEEANGYRPTQQNNKEVRNMIQQLKSLKRQIRTLRDSVDSGVNLDDSPSMSPTRPWSPSRTDFSNILNVYSDTSGSNENSLDSHDTLESRFNRVEKRLKEIEFELKKERQVSGRPESLEDMNPDQVLQEKNSIQLALNEAQTILNTLMNASEEERSVLKEFLKDLLTRYRSVKRLVRRSSNVFIKDPCELETIPEGAEIQLTLASPQHRINIEMNSSPSRILDQTDLMPARSSSNNSLPKDVTDETDNNANEPNLHAMSRFELLDVQKVAKEDKKQLRKCLKEHEVKFLEVNGRPMPKDELKEHELYSKYKMTKAKLKLVDALLSKSVKQ